MNTYLIEFKNYTTDEQIQKYLNDNSLSLNRLFNRLDNTYYINSEAHPPLTEIVDTIIDDNDTYLNLLSTIDVPMPLAASSIKSLDSNDEHEWWKLYSLMDADLDKSIIEAKIFGQGINVYMLDSGIDINHTEFINKNINLVYSFTDDFFDNNGHGTGLSSLIIGNKCGLTDCTLNVVKIFDKNVPTRQSDLLSALNAILEDASISQNKVSIVNCSWSIPKNSFIESKIQCLIDAGIFVVAASGNSGIPISDATPASMHDVFTIGSYGQEFVPSNFSNYTNNVLNNTANENNFGELDCWAPGENIYLAIPGNNEYTLASGTSMACAIFSGSLAYNFSQELTNTGEVPAGIRFNKTMVRGPLSRSRKGLLDLSDPRYSSSANTICTYTMPFLNVSILDIISFDVQAVVYPGKTAVRRFIFPDLVQSYEILGDLPNGVIVDGFYLTVKFLNEPVSEDHLDRYSIPVRFDLRDGSTINKKIDIAHVGSAFDADSHLDSPVIEIVAQLSGPCPPTRSPCLGQSCGCPSPDTLVLMGDKTNKPAGELKIGDLVYTIHESTKEFGRFMITEVQILQQPMLDIVFTDNSTIRVSESHKFLMDSGLWKKVGKIEEGSIIQQSAIVKGFETNKTIKSITKVGLGPAVKITVDQAHTYISEGLISHNLKATTGTCNVIARKVACSCI
jgi:hypothetical protein